MFCSKCGSKIPDGASFCPKCGQTIEQAAAEGDDTSRLNNDADATVPVNTEGAADATISADPGSSDPTTVLPARERRSAGAASGVSNAAGTESATNNTPFSNEGERVGDEPSARKPNSRRTALWVCVAVAAIVLVGALVWHSMNPSNANTQNTSAQSNASASIPDVTGMSLDDAKKALEDAGFVVQVAQEASDQDENTVVSVDPAAGTQAKQGDQVTITVAIPRTIPNVVGKTEDEAKQALSDAGATNVVVKTEASADATEGTVSAVEPTEGSAFKSGDQVTLTVATKEGTVVPDVTGKNQDDAVSALQQAGFAANVQWQESTSIYPQVVSTDPAPGSSATPGQTVTVYVASPGARSELYLQDYLACSRENIEKYLSWKGWTKIEDDGTWVCWQKSGLGTLSFGKDRMQIDDTPNDPPAPSFNFVDFTPESNHDDGLWVHDYSGTLAGPTDSLAYLAKAEGMFGFSGALQHYNVGDSPASYTPDGYTSVAEVGAAGNNSYWFVMEETSPYDNEHRFVAQVATKDVVGSDAATALESFFRNEHVG